jgi:hypothetical protein
MKRISLLLFLFLNVAITYAQRLPYASTIEFHQDNKWDSAYYNTYEYNSSGLEVSTTTTEWSTIDLVWNNFDRNEYEYNPSGKQTKNTRFVWDDSGKRWYQTQRILTTYYDTARVSSIEIQPYNLGWRSLSLDSMFYNPDGSLALTKKYWWNGSNYAYSGRRTYSYNANGRVISMYYEWISSSPTVWDTINRTLYTYALPNSDTATQQLYDNGQWINEIKIINNYNLDKLLIGREIVNYIVASATWVGQDSNQYFYHPDKVKDMDINKVWDDTALAYALSSKLRYLYNDNVGVKKSENDEFIQFFPNPTQDYVDVVINQLQLGGQLTLFNMGGQLLIHKPITGNERVDLRELPAGQYLIQVQNGNYNTKQLIIKQ